jgi:hypothetical protein
MSLLAGCPCWLRELAYVLKSICIQGNWLALMYFSDELVLVWFGFALGCPMLNYGAASTKQTW